MKTILAMLMLASATIAVAQQGVPHDQPRPDVPRRRQGSAGMQQDYESCRRSEENARDILVQQWTGFLAADREAATG